MPEVIGSASTAAMKAVSEQRKLNSKFCIIPKGKRTYEVILLDSLVALYMNIPVLTGTVVKRGPWHECMKIIEIAEFSYRTTHRRFHSYAITSLYSN